MAVNDPTLETCVAACASLTSLSLQRCVAVTDAGLAALARLPRLARLCVAGTRVAGGDGGAALAAMAPRLACLDAAGCAALGDGALRALRGGSPGGQQAALREVHLGGTACTNAGLAHLTVRRGCGGRRALCHRGVCSRRVLWGALCGAVYCRACRAWRTCRWARRLS